MSVSESGAYATSSVRMPAWATRKGARAHAGRDAGGERLLFADFFRLESGMPQIGQRPGSPWTTFGCIGQ